MAITYDKFFRITNCDTIIFLEDDFAFKNSKESLFYGLARLNGNSRERLYVELKDAGADFVDELQEYSATVSGYIEAIDWENEIPRDDIETLFSIIEGGGQDGGLIGVKLRKNYANIDVKDMVKFATVYKGNIIKNLIMDCQSYTKYRPNETTGGIFVSWRRKEELPTGA